MKNICLVLTRDPDELEKKLQNYDLPDLEIIIGRTDEIIRAYISKADIIFGNPPIGAEFISQASNLKWFQSTFAGVDALVSSDFPRDYILTNVKDTYGKPMVEYVFTYILGIKRKIFENRQWQKEHNWNQFSYDVIGKETIGVVGTGSIGKEIARISKAFGMKTKGLNTKGNSVEYFDHVYGLEESTEFFQGVDYLVSVLPNTPQTHHFFNKEVFELMNSKPIFINVGRGQNVCEKDLIEALDKEKISTAVLDVFEQEPLPRDSNLWDLPNVYITPHVSGYVTTDTAFEIFEKNYHNFRNKVPLDHQIDFSKGY